MYYIIETNKDIYTFSKPEKCVEKIMELTLDVETSLLLAYKCKNGITKPLLNLNAFFLKNLQFESNLKILEMNYTKGVGR